MSSNNQKHRNEPRQFVIGEKGDSYASITLIIPVFTHDVLLTDSVIQEAHKTLLRMIPIEDMGLLMEHSRIQNETLCLLNNLRGGE